jgi:hypothetical protein
MAGFPHSLMVSPPLWTRVVKLSLQKCWSLRSMQMTKQSLLIIGWRETTRPRLWCWPLLPQRPTAPSLAGEPQLLVPGAHDSQLDTINRLHGVINSVRNRPTALPWQPMQVSVCAALLERLGNTSATGTTGIHYKIKFQYDTTAFTVMVPSKGGCLPFDPC